MMRVMMIGRAWVLVVALAACGGTSKPAQPVGGARVAVAWTTVAPPEAVMISTHDNVAVAIRIAGAAHDLGTALGDSISGAQGPAACFVATPSATETTLTCASGMAYTRFVATLDHGQVVVVRHEGVDTGEDIAEDHVKGELARVAVAGTALAVGP